MGFHPGVPERATREGSVEWPQPANIELCLGGPTLPTRPDAPAYDIYQEESSRKKISFLGMTTKLPRVE